MDFRTFVALAEALAAGGTEAEWRTAVSRAYYGAFHVACDLFDALGFDVRKADRAHGYAHLRLENSSDEAVSEAGSKLHDLLKRRNRADYDQRAKFNATDADDAVEEARLIIEALDDAFTEPTRSQITDAIKKYERDVLKEVTWRA